MDELPLLDDAATRERADAARNRERILAAAAELIRERGIDRVSMDDVARAACVGTGTVYRRFGGRAGLALALLDEESREFQDALLHGPPPLGPGAPAAERLRAFGAGYLDLLEAHAPLLAAASELGLEGHGPLQLYTVHLTVLLAEAAPHADAEFTAHALMAVLSPGAHVHARGVRQWPVDRLREGWDALVGALCP